MTARNRGTREAGYLVVEALVALLIVAAMTGLLFETMSSQAASAGRIEQHRMALLVAQSQLAAAMAGALPASEGDTGDIHWSLSVEPAAADARGGRLTLDEITVAVAPITAPGRPLLVLKSLRVGA